MTNLTSLQNAIPALAGRDQEFALSLMNQWANRGSLTEKQFYWVGKLIERATTPAAPAPQVTASIAPIVELLANARKRSPALLVGSGVGDIRVTLASSMAREPGSLTVCHNDRTNDEGRRLWLGRITRAGAFQASRSLTADEVAQITEALVAFAADPLTAAREYGRRTNTCCFCAHGLTDGISVELGYGPVCARRWNLGHNAKTVAALHCVAA